MLSKFSKLSKSGRNIALNLLKILNPNCLVDMEKMTKFQESMASACFVPKQADGLKIIKQGVDA